MKTVTLTKPWGKSLPGTILEVDDLRAEALERDGFLDEVIAEKKPAEISKVKAPAGDTK